MILRFGLSTLLLVAVTLVQTTWLNAAAILGVRPDLSLLAVLWLAYRLGPAEGSSLGFISGLVDDVLSAAPLGFNAFVKTLVAWLASFLHGAVQLDRVLLPMLLGGVGTILKAVAVSLLGLLFRDTVQGYDFLGRALWIEVGYNAVAAPFFFLIVGGLFAIAGFARRGEE